MLVFCCLGSLAEAAREPVASSPNHATRISTEEFLASPFARYVQAEDYPNALKALDTILKTYPDDPLILRYRARVLARLGRTTEAISLYRRLLSKDSRHAPTRIFLGQAYLQDGQPEAAAEQWHWIIRHGDSAAYRQWAQAQLNRLRMSRKPLAVPERRLYLVGRTGLKYDSNPILKPDDKALAESGNEKAGWELPVDLTLGYPVWLAPATRLDVLYLNQEIVHDGETSAVNFTTQGVAVAVKHRMEVGRRAVLFGGRYGTRVNFLRSELFSVVNRLLLSAETAFTHRTRTYVYGRASLANFGPDGSNPPQTSRDGFYGALGLTQYFYTSDLQRHVFVSQELDLQETRGANFTRRGTISRIGIHTPLLRQTTWDVSTGFEWGRYPRFVSRSSLDRARRRDIKFDVSTGLTYHWNTNLATRVSYQFIRSDNRNDFFDRTRHVAGVEMLFTY